jgi:hypothetical protein
LIVVLGFASIANLYRHYREFSLWILKRSHLKSPGSLGLF